MIKIALLAVVVCGVGLFLPWIVAGEGATVAAAQGASPSGEAPRSLNVLPATDGPILLGLAIAALVLLLLAGVIRGRWVRVLAFLAVGALAAFCYLDWQTMKDPADFVQLGDWAVGKPREVGIGPVVATAGAAVSALFALFALFRPSK